MTKTDFLLGLMFSLIIGIPLSFYNQYIAAIVGVLLGGMVAASKKGGGAIGFLTFNFIIYSPYLIPVLTVHLSKLLAGNQLEQMFALLMIFSVLIDVKFFMYLVFGVIIGIIGGIIGAKFTKKEEKADVLETLEKIEL